MQRGHLLEWRQSLPPLGRLEYFREVDKLPEADRETAAALYGLRTSANDMLTVVTAMSVVDQYRDYKINDDTLPILSSGRQDRKM